MAQFQNIMDVFKLLDKSNCRQCNAKTCLVFAADVFAGNRPLSDCLKIAPEILSQYSVQEKQTSFFDLDFEKSMHELTTRIKSLDFSETARRIGARHEGARLVLKIMGKDFAVDTSGRLISDLHVNPWITGPVLSYIIHCKGTPLTQQWVPLRELPHGNDWHRFFSQQCEKPLKKLADTYTDLFEDLVQIFNGRQVENHYQSDVAVILEPLPLVPLLICYWKPEDGMESDLNLFFDAASEDNLGIGDLYGIGTGIVRMFQKLAQRHGH
jgi:hypothetical protein